MLLLPASIDPHRVRDALLAALAVAAGSVDALAWLALGKVFSAFMTGNVVFIAVGLSSHDSGLALHAAVAVCAFGAGAFATARLMPREAPAVLWPARVTIGLLGTAFVQLAFWIVWLAVGGDPGSKAMLVLLAISALAMGIQTATAVALGVHAVFTTAATATWTVLAGDAAHWSANADRAAPAGDGARRDADRGPGRRIAACTRAVVDAVAAGAAHGGRRRGRAIPGRAAHGCDANHGLVRAAPVDTRVRTYDRQGRGGVAWALSRIPRPLVRWQHSLFRTTAGS